MYSEKQDAALELASEIMMLEMLYGADAKERIAEKEGELEGALVETGEEFAAGMRRARKGLETMLAGQPLASICGG